MIYSPNLATHQDHVNQVLKRLLEHHLYVKAEKSVFHADTVSFLGFIVAPGRVQMDPAKVSAVADWPTPDSPVNPRICELLQAVCQGLQRNSCSSPCSYLHPGPVSLELRG